jgi:hypothetical protein
MYANPRTKEVDSVLIENYDPEFVLSAIVNQDSQRLEKEALQVKDYEKTRAFLNKHYPEKGKLIEVGSGLGYLLNFFKQDGWNVLGLEPNVGMCRYAESEFGIKIIPTILEKAELEDRSADAILLMFKLLGKRERSLSCDGHIYFFTTSTLEKLATKAGFTVLKTDYVGRSLTLDRLFYNLGVVSKSQVIKQILKDVSVKLHLNKISLYLNTRDMERIYLKKPDSASE